MVRKIFIAGPLKCESHRTYLDEIEETVKGCGFDTFSPYKEIGILSDEDYKNPMKVIEVLEKDLTMLQECDGILFLIDDYHAGTMVELGYIYYHIKNMSKEKILIGLYTTNRNNESMDSMVKFCFEDCGIILKNLKELRVYLNNMEEIKKENELIKIKNEYKERDYIVKISSNELISICPFTNLRDFYTIKIIYNPNEYLIEEKSLKFYLMKFENMKITHESLLNKIYEDLLESLQPIYLKIEIISNVRGGLKTELCRESKNYEFYENSNLPNFSKKEKIEILSVKNYEIEKEITEG